MSGSRRLYRLLLFIAFILAFTEATLRTWYTFAENVPFFHPERIVLKYYPELKSILWRDALKADLEVLILGGSVVYSDTVTVALDGITQNSTFCDLTYTMLPELTQIARGQSINITSLARPAHNSLDSWYKYQLLQDLSFDLVIIYHGINDTRANNCPRDIFDLDYRHISFYNELYVYFRHPEINKFVTPYFLDLAFQKILVRAGFRQTIPRDYSRFYKTQAFEGLFSEGDDIKTTKTFRTNLEDIIKLARNKNEKVLLSTYAHYLAEGYTIDKFIAHELDYAEQIYPVELYGSPKNVLKGLLAHNKIITDLKDNYPDVLFADVNSVIPKDGNHFNDICHLTDRGCAIMAKEFTQVVRSENHWGQ